MTEPTVERHPQEWVQGQTPREPVADCPHCIDGHESPSRCAWGVRVGPDRDGDGQPVSLLVQPTDGAHVAEQDAEWVRQLIRAWVPPGRWSDPMRIRAQVLKEAAAEVLTLADAVYEDGTFVFGENDADRMAARIIAGYIESWASRPELMTSRWTKFTGGSDG